MGEWVEGGRGSCDQGGRHSHPVAVTLAATLVHGQNRHVLTTLLQTGLDTHAHTHRLSRVPPPYPPAEGRADLAGSAGGALGNGGRVRHVVAQVEEGSPAHLVAVVEGHVGGKDLGIGAQQGALPAALTLESAAAHVAAGGQSVVGGSDRLAILFQDLYVTRCLCLAINHTLSTGNLN